MRSRLIWKISPGKKSISNMLKPWNVMLTGGIICIMSILAFNSSCAKTAFSKQKVEGVMSTAVGRQVVVSWESLKNATGYEVYECSEALYEKEGASGKVTHITSGEVSDTKLIKRTKNCKVILKDRTPGYQYHYYVVAYKISKTGSKGCSKKSAVTTTTVSLEGKSTLKNFLRTAIAPIGNTMYVWGGGWNKADTAAGKEARSTGLSANWRSFAKGKKADYNYKNYRYLIHKGLDCSGYVGWCMYNIQNTINNKKGYVYSASKQAKKFADMGYGKYIETSKVDDYKPGDIMSSTCSCCGHVWIVVGRCEDGSVVLVHASPPGVQLSGTVTPEGNKNSDAVKLARKYMKKYYPDWYKRYPEVSKGSTYLSHYGQMRWNTKGKGMILSDPDGYQEMWAEEVLKDLFEK